jgi:uncharacterized membrane protein
VPHCFSPPWTVDDVLRGNRGARGRSQSGSMADPASAFAASSQILESGPLQARLSRSSLGMISALINIALISAKAVLVLIAAILIVPGLGIAAMVWYMRRWRARKLRPQIALEALNQRYAPGDIGRTEYLQNRDDILAAQRTASAASAGSRQ